jgi:hypothetical protein
LIFYHLEENMSIENELEFYFLAGCRGGAGSDPAGLPCWGTACFGITLMGFTVEGIIEVLSGLLERYARVREVSMNIMAAPVVSLLRKVAPPPTPNND